MTTIRNKRAPWSPLYLSGRALGILLQLFGRLDDDRSCHRSDQDQRNEDNHCTDTNGRDVVALFVLFQSSCFSPFFFFSPALRVECDAVNEHLLDRG